jgi:predicted dehydrogenase
VRWTEQRNFDAILQAIAGKKLDVAPLITERVKLADYGTVYGNMGGSSIASILEYDTTGTGVNGHEVLLPASTVRLNHGASFKGAKGVVGVIGAGNFTKMTMMPALKGTGAHLKYVASAGGVSAHALAKKYRFSHSTTDFEEILKDQEIDLVMITTRHNQHARMSVAALGSGKHVFVEKPLALDAAELADVKAAYEKTGTATITVGFNRRFSPYIQKAKSLLGTGAGPINMIATMNAGAIPPEVWVHDMQVGGGRIVGEACHFIDLMIYLSHSKVTSVFMSALGAHPATNTDNAIITLNFQNGSQGVINYFANGSKAYAKERVEIYSQGRTLIVDNFRKLEGFGFSRFSRMSGRLDKGHKAQFSRLIQAVQAGGDPLIPFDELENSSAASFACLQSLEEGVPVRIPN